MHNNKYRIFLLRESVYYLVHNIFPVPFSSIFLCFWLHWCFLEHKERCPLFTYLFVAASSDSFPYNGHCNYTSAESSSAPINKYCDEKRLASAVRANHYAEW